MKSPPLVSLIVPCYNHACYLPDALESVLAQTYPHWECIIVNDCSPDNTREVAEAWMVKDTRFQLVNAEKNGGLAASRNLGIAHSKGEYILPLDADDKLHPSYIEKSVKHLGANPELKLVYSDVYHFGAEEGIVRRPMFDIRLLCHQNLIHCCAVIRKQAFLQTVGYRTNMIYGYEDWDIWMQMLTSSADCFKISEPLVYLRAKEDSMYKNLVAVQEREKQMREQLRQNNPDFFANHLAKQDGLVNRLLKRLRFS